MSNKEMELSSRYQWLIDDCWEEVLNISFYVIVILYMSYLYVQTLTFDAGGARLPQFVILIGIPLSILGLIITAIDILIKYEYPPMPQVLHKLRASKFDRKKKQNSVITGANKRDKLPRLSLVAHLGSVVAFVLSMAVIGPFTTVFVFTAGYAYISKNEIIKSVLWGAVLTLLLYVLFVEILGMRLLLNLGVVY